MSQSTPQPLTYGLRQRPRRRWAAALVMAALAAGASLLVFHAFVRQPLRAWQDRRRLQREITACADYRLPADTVVFEPNPDAAARLIRSGEYDDHPPPNACRIGRPWEALVASMGWPEERWAVFCHARTSPAGHHRLVVVERLKYSGSGLIIDATGSPPRRLPCTWRNYILFRRINRADPEVRLYAGQPDPDDASHFTIGYALGESRGSVDGWLLDDDTLRFRVLSGPCKRPLEYFLEEEGLEPPASFDGTMP